MIPTRRTPISKRLCLAAGTLLLFAALILPLAAQDPAPCSIDAFAGSGFVLTDNGGPALEAELYFPRDIRRGSDGLHYIADTNNNVIRRILADGTIETFAGTGRRGYSGDGGPAREADLNRPTSMAFGPDGSLYFFDSNNGRIRRIRPNGNIETIAGDGLDRFAGDGGPAAQASIGANSSLTVDPNGVILLVTPNHHRLRAITPDGMIRTLAGLGEPMPFRGGFSGDGGPAAEAQLNGPTDVAVDRAGSIYIADEDNRRIRRISPDGVIETYVGTGSLRRSSDGSPRSGAPIELVYSIELDPEGRLYWAERGTIRRIGDGDSIETVAESPLIALSPFVVVESDKLYLIRSHQVFRTSPGGEPSLLAGIGNTAGRGDGGPAAAAKLGRPHGLAAGLSGEIYIADEEFSRVRVVTPDGRIANFAGTGEPGFTGDGGLAIDAGFSTPWGVAVDSLGNVYISDKLSHRLRRVNTAGIVETVAGNGRRCSLFPNCDLEGPAVETVLQSPSQVAVDSRGVIYVMEETPRRTPVVWIRKIDPEGMATVLPFPRPNSLQNLDASAIAIDRNDRLIISTGRSNSAEYWVYTGQEGMRSLDAANGYLAEARGLAVSPRNDLHIAENVSQIVRRLSPEGYLNRVAGTGEFGEAGNGGPALEAQLSTPHELAFDADGNLYFVEAATARIRRIYRAVDCERTVGPEMARFGVLNAASYQAPNLALAPGVILSIFGRRLGPDELIVASLDNDRFPTELGGTRVLLDGVPAPLIFSSSGQVGAVVPFETALTPFDTSLGFPLYFDHSVIEVENLGVRSEKRLVTIVETMPGIFTLNASGSGPGAILNQDDTVNGPLNPAAPGSIIVIYATGGGLTDPAYQDGEIVGLPLPYLKADIEVEIAGQPAEVLYAGGAPGLVAGVVQINARVPDNLPTQGPQNVIFKAAGIPSQTVTVIIGN